MTVDGIAYTFGVYMNEFAKYYNEGPGKVAWVGSLLSGVYLTAGMTHFSVNNTFPLPSFYHHVIGPIVSGLCNKFGCRAVCIAGSIIACCAFILSTFSVNVNMLMLTYGVMGGFGFGMIYLPAVVLCGLYFEKKRSLATGIAVCGR
jgi:MFS family permease